MSGPSPDLPTTDEPVDAAPPEDLPPDDLPAPDAVDAADLPDVDAVVAAEDGRPSAEDLGLFAPTWYVLLCAVPFAAAFLVPMMLIYQGQNSVPPISATAASWHGVLAGWLLWGTGLVFWLLGKVVLAGPRRRAPHAWAWWDRMTRAWVLVVLVWGLVASFSVVVVGLLIDRLAA
jgi:hypothetical protein